MVIKIMKKMNNGTITQSEVDESDFGYAELFQQIQESMNHHGCTLMNVGMPGMNVVFERKEE